MSLSLSLVLRSLIAYRAVVFLKRRKCFLLPLLPLWHSLRRLMESLPALTPVVRRPSRIHLSPRLNMESILNPIRLQNHPRAMVDLLHPLKYHRSRLPPIKQLCVSPVLTSRPLLIHCCTFLQLIAQVLSMTQQQIDQLPPDSRNTIMQIVSFFLYCPGSHLLSLIPPPLPDSACSSRCIASSPLRYFQRSQCLNRICSCSLLSIKNSLHVSLLTLDMNE